MGADGKASGGHRPDDRLALDDARLRRAQSVARLGSWELDLSRNVMWGSDESFRIYGLPLSPDNSLPFAIVKDIPLPESRPALDQAMRGLLVEGRPYEIRFRIRRYNDGAVRHIHSFAEVSRDAAGKPLVVTGTMQDVTEHEEAQRALQDALKANEERALLLLEQAPDAILQGDAGGNFVGANARACELTGYSREELLGRNVSMLFSPQALAASPMRYDRILAGETVITERMLVRKDGTQVAVDLRGKRLSDGTLQAIVRDISDRKRLEEQLQLRQRMDSLGTLSGGIAHDFNNILTAIVGYADVLRLTGGALSPLQRDSVDNILQAGRRAADLVRGLQALSSSAPVETETFDLHKLASEVFHVLRETTDRIIAKDVLIGAGRFFVRGNASALYHAFMNLGINAVQAIESWGEGRGGRVTLDARDYVAGGGDTLRLQPGRYVHVLVTDTGIGMSSEVRQRAFDPLFTTKQKGDRKGQGLGLAMVYNTIVTQHGGVIDVESAEGRGSTMHVYLPGVGENAAAMQSRMDDVVGGTETILVVDDEPSLLRLTRQVLGGAGYQVLCASDGQEAVEMFRERMYEIALVLLDRTLPRLSGEGVLRQITAMRPQIKVIVSSGDANLEERGLPPTVRLLRKPYTTALLCGVVREVLDGGG